MNIEYKNEQAVLKKNVEMAWSQRKNEDQIAKQVCEGEDKEHQGCMNYLFKKRPMRDLKNKKLLCEMAYRKGKTRNWDMY